MEDFERVKHLQSLCLLHPLPRVFSSSGLCIDLAGLVHCHDNHSKSTHGHRLAVFPNGDCFKKIEKRSNAGGNLVSTRPLNAV